MTTNLGYSNGVAFFYVMYFIKRLTFKHKKAHRLYHFEPSVKVV